MAGESASSDLLKQLNILVAVGAAGDLSDSDLLRRFLGGQVDDSRAALSTLVDRHGPMVLRACRHVLGDPHDAQDAFQATFLVLVRKARSVRNADSVAGWLHGVALRVSLRARADAARRRASERRSMALKSTQSGAEENGSPSWIDLHEEVARLPGRYREPVVLCYFEGLSTEAAALRIGCPRGTVLSRLSRARERLRASLTRRGLVPSAALLSSRPTPVAVEALPRALSSTTVRAALSYAGRQASGPVLASATSIALARGAASAMNLSKLKILGTATLACSLALGGAKTFGDRFGGFASVEEPIGVAATPLVGRAPPPVLARGDDDKARETSIKILREAYQAIGMMGEVDPVARVFTLIRIAKAQARSGERVDALATLESAYRIAEALDPTRASNELVAVAYAHWEAGDRRTIPVILRHAWEAARGIDDKAGKVGGLGEVSEALAWTGDPGAASEVAREAFLIAAAEDRVNDRFFLLMRVVYLQAGAGEFDAAFRTVDLAANDRDRRTFLGQIATAAGSANHYFLQPTRELTLDQKAERIKVLHRILDATRDPTIEVAIALGDLGETEDALRLAGLMGKGKLDGAQGYPTSMPWILMRIAIAQAKSGKPEDSRKTFQEALDLIRRNPETNDRLEQIAAGQAETGDVDGGLKTVELIPITDKGRVLTKIADFQSEWGDAVAAAKTLRLALNDARIALASPPSGKPGTVGADPEYWKATTLDEVASIQAKLGDFPAALASALEMPEKSRWGPRKAHALSVIAKEQARSGKVEEAMEWVKRLDQPGDRVSALGGLAEGMSPSKSTD
jgi:RNA polymerase sigma factor (sigma-70 family)